jgi:peroxiredoxin
MCAAVARVSAQSRIDPPKEGEPLPPFSLPVPTNADQKAYLGLVAGESFKIHQIRAKIVVIEIFSMYCPYCQREAPTVNRLFKRIESDPKLKDQIKMIGIGAGNSPFEVDVFRKKYDVAFPLFPDDTFAIHECLGEVRTPYFFVVKINDDGTHRIIISKLGGIKDADRFLDEILKVSEPGQEG